MAAGCGGGSGSDTGGGGSGAVKEGGIFTLGSTNYIDTLNVFNYIEASGRRSFHGDLPGARAVRPGSEGDRPELRRVVDGLAGRQDLDVQAASRAGSGRTASR